MLIEPLVVRRDVSDYWRPMYNTFGRSRALTLVPVRQRLRGQQQQLLGESRPHPV